MRLNPTKNTAIPQLKPPYCVSDSWVHSNTVSQLTLGQHFVAFNTTLYLTISSSSASTRSYALRATQKMMAVTPSKQWIHFFLSDLCPPTSNILQHQQKNKLLKFILPFQNFFPHYYYSLSKMLYCWNSQQDICNNEQLVLHWCTILSRASGQNN